MQTLADLVGAAEAAQERAERKRDGKLELQRKRSERLLETVSSSAVDAAEECWRCGGAVVPFVVDEPLPWDAGHRRVGFPDRCPACGAERGVHHGIVFGPPPRSTPVPLIEEEEAGERWGRRLERAGLVGRLAEATLGTFFERDDWPGARGALRKAAQYKDALLRRELGLKPWLVLTGAVGTGKTHLAAALVRAAVAAGEEGCHYRDWSSYLAELQAGWNGGGGRPEREIVAEVARGRFVALDDVDKRDPTPWVRSALFAALNERWLRNVPTVVAMNAPAGALADLFGAALADRVLGSAWAVVEFDGPSYRSGVEW